MARMKEAEARELAAVIQEDVPWLRVDVQSAALFDESAAGSGDYVVVMMGETFSAELYNFDEWIRLVEQLEAGGTNIGPKAITAAALQAWARAKGRELPAWAQPGVEDEGVGHE